MIILTVAETSLISMARPLKEAVKQKPGSSSMPTSRAEHIEGNCSTQPRLILGVTLKEAATLLVATQRRILCSDCQDA